MFANAARVKSAVLTVGDGRGFVVRCRDDQLVVTAAHCLPFFLPCFCAIAMTGNLQGDSFGCTIAYTKRIDGPLWNKSTLQLITDGMSSSAIISDHGAAIEVVNLDTPLAPEDQGGSPTAGLFRDLPGWLLRA